MADAADIAGDYIEAALETGLERRVRYVGESLKDCEECGNELPEGRRVALPGVRLCVYCQTALERRR